MVAFESRSAVYKGWPKLRWFQAGPLFILSAERSGTKCRRFRTDARTNREVLAEYSPAMAAGLGRECPTNAQLFLIGNSAPMDDLHSGARASLNPRPCQTQPWGKVEGREKNKKEQRLEFRRGKKQARERTNGRKKGADWLVHV